MKKKLRYNSRSIYSRTATFPLYLPFHFCVRRQLYQYGCPHPSPFRRSCRPRLRGVASSSPPRPCANLLVPVTPRDETVRRFDDPPVSLPTLRSRPLA